MTISGNGQPPFYRVSMSGETKTEIRRFHRQAVEAGNGQQFLSAYRRICNQLKQSPKVFGEPLYHLPALKLAIRMGVIIPLVVVYGVHDEQPHVFIRGFEVLS